MIARLRLPAALLAALLVAATAAPAVAQGSNRSATNGGYLGSRLLPPKSAKACPPGTPRYRAAEIVTGTDMRQRPWGFAQALREVLVKVSGDPRLRDDPRTAQLAAGADRFVACFDYLDMMADVPLHDDQGTADRPHRLTVHFDPAKIDAILARLGERPWPGVRPALVPVLLVRGPQPPPYLLSVENPRTAEQRGSFATAAQQFGMKPRIPDKAALAAWSISAEHFPAEGASSPAGRSPGEMIVVGTLRWSESLPGWIGRWRTRWHGRNYAWGVSGVNYDAAFRDIVAGAVSLASGHGAPK